MENLLIKHENANKISPVEAELNIKIATHHVDDFDAQLTSKRGPATYKTVAQFSLTSFFSHFGFKETDLYRLIKSQQSYDLPTVIIIHTNQANSQKDDAPIIIAGDLFITHTYFIEWIKAVDIDAFEKPLLKLILSNMDANPVFS